MRQESPRRAFLITLSIGVLALALSACGQTSLEEFAAQNDKDEGLVINSYRNHLLRTMQKNCGSCHAEAGTMSTMPHSDPDARVAWTAAELAGLWNFTTPESSKLIKKVKGGHNCWGNCVANASELVQKVNSFKAAVGSEIDGLGANDGDEEEFSFTEPVAIPANLDTSRMQNNQTVYDARDITFNLDALTGIAGSRLIIRVNRGNNQPAYSNYFFSNLRVISSQPMYLRKIVVLVNEVRDPSNNTYDFVEANVNATPNAGVVIDNGIMSVLKQKGPGQDMITIGFGAIGKGAQGAAPTFNEIMTLLKTSPSRCIDCHATNFLSDANTADVNTFKNQQYSGGRIINAGSPTTSELYNQVNANAMPRTPTGGAPLPFMSREDKDKIYRWIQSLTP